MSQQENSFTHSFTASLCLYFFSLPQSEQVKFPKQIFAIIQITFRLKIKWRTVWLCVGRPKWAPVRVLTPKESEQQINAHFWMEFTLRRTAQSPDLIGIG